MESSKNPKPVNPMTALIDQIHEYKKVLAAIINDGSLNKKGKYDVMIVPGNPPKSEARTMWNLLTTYEKFLEKMNKKNIVQKGAKAGVLAGYTMRLYDELNKAFACDLIYATSAPSADKLKKIPGDAPSAYVFVANAQGKFDRLFYVRRDAKICQELKTDEEFLARKPRRISELDKAYPIEEVDLEFIDFLTEGTTHTRPRQFSDASEDSLKMLEAQLRLLSVFYNADTKKFNPGLVNPIMAELMRGVPDNVIIPLLQKVFPLIPKDFNLKEYLDVNNVKEHPEYRGLGSFNEYLEMLYDDLQNDIHDQRWVLYSESDSFEESSDMSSESKYAANPSTTFASSANKAEKKEKKEVKEEEKKEKKEHKR